MVANPKATLQPDYRISASPPRWHFPPENNAVELTEEGKMPEYGTCTQCGREIDPFVGYSNVSGIKERICLPCQFPGAAHKEQKAEVHAVIHRKQSSGFSLTSGPVARISMWLGELTRRSSVANEAHATGPAENSRPYATLKN
jgi:hypothetical protein